MIFRLPARTVQVSCFGGFNQKWESTMAVDMIISICVFAAIVAVLSVPFLGSSDDK